METEVGIVYRFAITKLNVITDLEAEAIPIVVCGNNVLEKPPVAVLDEDSTGEIAVNVFVLVAVASPVRNSLLGEPGPRVAGISNGASMQCHCERNNQSQ
jgi:hypothetical protein